jgi:hypothetical protein
MTSATTRGRIAYLDLQRNETGREFFSFTRYADGSRTVRCECHFDDLELVRDVSFTLDREWRPNDAYLRISHGGKALGAGWFRFGNGKIHCDAIDGDGNHQHFSRPYVGSKPAFGAHPIFNDGLWTALFDLRRPNEVQRLTDCITYSKETVGKESIAIETFDLDVQFRGTEDVVVPAGRFTCRSFAVQLLGLKAPFMIWTFGDDHIVAKESWAEMPFTYELAELR